MVSYIFPNRALPLSFRVTETIVPIMLKQNDALRISVTREIERIALLLQLKVKEKSDAGLFSGKAGFCLLFYELYKVQKNDDASRVATALLDDVLCELPKVSSFSFASGLCGMAWMIQYLIDEGYYKADSDFMFGDLDKLVFDASQSQLAAGQYDYLYQGLSGIMYLVSRYRTSKRKGLLRKYIVMLIHELERKGLQDEGGIFWYDYSFYERKEQGLRINFGLAHGVPSIIAMLAIVLKEGIVEREIEVLLTRSCKYILYHKGLYSTGYSSFPDYLVEKGPEMVNDSRLAWCYGDLGIATALLNASEALNDKDLYSNAMDIALASMKRTHVEQTFVKDSCLCHGSAGLMHIYNILYKKTKNPAFFDQSVYWFKYTLSEGDQSGFLGGYKFLSPNGWVSKCDLLEGLAGVGMAMLTLLTVGEARWDRCLLLS